MSLSADQLAQQSPDVPITTPASSVFVITRLGYRNPLHVIMAYVRYRRLANQAKRVPGLLQTSFMIESPRTCYTLSIWRDYHSIAVFGSTVTEHVDAVRQAIGRLRWTDAGPETWSAKLEPFEFHQRLGPAKGAMIRPPGRSLLKSRDGGGRWPRT